MDLSAITDAMHARFVALGGDELGWPEPRGFGELPREDEYSRVTDPDRYRIVALRARAWIDALVGAGLARAADTDPGVFDRHDVPVAVRLDPAVAGGVPLTLGLGSYPDTDDAGVVVAAGDPPRVLTWVPHCGCDACDDGSQRLLDDLDEIVGSIVGGDFLHLDVGDAVLTRLGGSGGVTAGLPSDPVQAVAYAHEHGLPVRRIDGPSWLDAAD